MNVTLTQAELGEAMRRLAILEGHKPTRFDDDRTGGLRPETIARRARVADLFDTGMCARDIQKHLANEGLHVSKWTVVHDSRAGRGA